MSEKKERKHQEGSREAEVCERELRKEGEVTNLAVNSSVTGFAFACVVAVAILAISMHARVGRTFVNVCSSK